MPEERTRTAPRTTVYHGLSEEVAPVNLRFRQRLALALALGARAEAPRRPPDEGAAEVTDDPLGAALTTRHPRGQARLPSGASQGPRTPRLLGVAQTPV